MRMLAAWHVTPSIKFDEPHQRAEATTDFTGHGEIATSSDFDSVVLKTLALGEAPVVSLASAPTGAPFFAGRIDPEWVLSPKPMAM
jgi:hypothetical protein